MQSNPKKRPTWPHHMLLPVIAGSLSLMVLLVSRAWAAPIEEDIPQSAPARHAQVRPRAVAPAEAPAAEPAATAADEPSNAPTHNAVDQSTAAPASVAAGSASSVPSVHKYFPYTIRPGDTLEAIADIFGVQVTDITRANHRLSDGDLMAGDTIRIPNPFVTRESELNAEVERLSIDKQEAERKGEQSANALAAAHSQLEAAAASNANYERDLHSLPWWRAAAWSAAIAFIVMFGVMAAAVIEWWNLRSRYRAVAEMNESLRRLDYRYRMLMARAELRLQQLYGRRRPGIEDGQERPRIPEEAEIEQLDRQIREILEGYLRRLGPPDSRARRALWRESISSIGAPVEARTLRR